MAVPGRRNGLMEEDDHEEENALFEEDGVYDDVEYDVPPHLRDFATAAQIGDVNALRIALDNIAECSDNNQGDDAADNLNGSIDEPVEDSDTALHLACLYGYLPCVQLLLERGANLEVKDEDGAIPLHDACAGGFTEIVQLLINTANNTECAKRMLETVDAEGDTPLHHAARGEHEDVIRLLLASGASPTKTNISGKTPCELADPNSEAKGVLEAVASVVTY